ncbi:ADP-ribose pyrophosphatase [Catenuloplanes nepalensis]|uniref:ADP-ribose pyrophosphatase n=1 Tax=Catenuloplanes nepalensis TaxID=587533 RepID=A0ABT9MWS9_9ACTN|nr:NUDIX hydrolase [Catenuloplanes nepalensis]MDP9795892.1 ADP-ribose pyrophosphatase [Catenuloplanes nepalensis]
MTGFAHAVVSRTERFSGRVFSVVTDRVTMPGGGAADRDYLRHVGSVGVVALDGEERVVLINQYRHAVGGRLWELPAGLRDVQGEDLAVGALRELAEEADLRAGRVDLLVDLHTSPGMTNEQIRIFLARDLSPVPGAERNDRTDEEADIEVRWVPLSDAVAMVFAGEITNAAAVVGVLAAARARDLGWAPLRATDTPTPA